MTAVAAQSMAWQQRRRNHPGPLGTDGAANNGGSGEQPTGGPQVELYIGGWIDVTALGLVRYQQGIRITRGQPDENQKTNPGVAAFRLANLDGRFNPNNPVGPYYGQFDRNTPVRISVPSGNTKSYRFWGEIASWPMDWDPTGNDAWVDVQGAGLLRRLGTGVNPLKSAPYLYWTATSRAFTGVAYWPMEDSAGATQFAPVLGGRPMQITGAPTLASYTGILPSNPLPTFTSGSSAFGIVPQYTPGGTNSLSGFTCYIAVPSGGETAQVLVTLASTGTFPTWELYYVTTGGGELGFRSRDASGNIVMDSGALAFSVNGTPTIVGIDLYQDNAGNVLFDIQLQAVAPGGANLFYSQQTAAASIGRITSIKLAPAGGLTGTTIGHVAVASTVGYLPTGDYQGTPGEQAAARFQRLCNLANVSSHIVFNAATFDLGPAMGPQHPGALLDLLQECADADGGILFELTDRVGLGYRTRDTLENQTSPVLALDYPSAQLADVPKPVLDDTYTRNVVTATRLNGTFAVATQSVGPLNTQTPPAGVGTYSTSITVNVAADSQIADQAGWRLHLGTVAEPRYPVIGVQLAQPEIASSVTLRQQILAVSPGDRIAVTNPPAQWLAPDALSELVIGYTEVFNQFTHHIQWNTRPESPYRVATTDDPVFGHADTDGSTLAVPAGPTDVTIQVATTNPSSPLWTTNGADFPFDIAVGGERMTVTGVTGSTSPQQFNVTRSVNGVVKPQAVNTNVQLWQPATVSM